MQTAQPTANILIVDDAPENLRLLTQLLQKQGYRVRPAPNGAHALATVLKAPPDLILLDVMMPEMDGYEVCRHLKQNPDLRHIPVIFLSALSDTQDKITAFTAGGVDYITKPFQTEEVLARVQIHLSLRDLQQKLERVNETLEEKVAVRTAVLAETNRNLQAEITQRIRTEQEKDRLLTAVAQQSEQLRKMTTWLIESQQQGNNATIDTYQQIQQDLSLAQSNLEVIHSTLPPNTSPIISNHLENTRQMLSKIEKDLARADTTIQQNSLVKQELVTNPILLLSTREREVIQLLGEGKSNADIAELLSVTPATIYTYSKRIRNKLNIPDLPSLIRFAIEQNLSS